MLLGDRFIGQPLLNQAFHLVPCPLVWDGLAGFTLITFVTRLS